MEMIFEWDPTKEKSNFSKHGIDFSFATNLFDQNTLEMVDTRKDYGEKRIIAIGRIEGRYITAVYTKRKNTIRIISARRAHDKERKKYQEIYEK